MARDLPVEMSGAADGKPPPGLIWCNDSEPGLGRLAAPDGFDYVDADGARVRDAVTLERIRKLAIPPAWTDVWICPRPRGHIQAVGRDARGRKQYRYHPRWREARDGDKYDRLVAFGRALPRLRRRVEADLSRRGLPREKVLAAIVRTMERTLIRVGNEAYARQNRSFGLTTLRDRHAKIGAERAVFEFRGKSGKVHVTGFRDRRLARVLKACQDLPGQRLFQYVDETGGRHAVESADVNAYIREAMGEDFSAKDFRTWAGTVAAARALVICGRGTSDAEGRRNVQTCVKAVARLLGNTAAVARSAYIHPAILQAYEAGRLDLSNLDGRRFELAVLRQLERGRG
ncbi:DNA topoisomerase IB [Phenylobacterium sp. SCN 70-31]|uniref:DNA topoisomerase IB n=1 Tax=Phenylobacterium sp. SCN 70-31 TaxID=1660129 RepID=UPI000868D307|nr:DNA topoisomerase IB [Phenylobacterium sp. SCN 70-31]ODT86576.1 MAG: DNA topoisomerase [Phenylobacterium sp. SCN 70-31]